MERERINIKLTMLIVVYMILIYSIENSAVINWIGSYLWNTWIQPIAWLSLLLLMRYKLPKVHSINKLKNQSVIRMWAFNCSAAYIVINLLAGLLQGFGESPYSHSIKGIITNLIAMVIVLAGRETIRSYLINSVARSKSKLGIIGIIIFMTLAQITAASFSSITDLKSLTIFLAEKGLPILCQNILASYLVLYGGALASSIYLGTIEVFMLLAPILPNMGWLGKGAVGIIVPSLALVIVSEAYAKLTKVSKAYKSKGESIWGWIPTAIISIVIIWFAVGVFPIYPSAIVTGSMKPMIDPGDVVLIDKMKSVEQLNGLKTGDVVQFKQDNILITHRILEIVEEDGQNVYRTKGDNNSVEDRELVKAEAIKGIVFKVIPKIGWPTLLFRSSSPDILEQVEF